MIEQVSLDFYSYYNGIRYAKKGAILTAATMTSKGRITIPAIVRAALGVEAGIGSNSFRLGQDNFRWRLPRNRLKP